MSDDSPAAIATSACGNPSLESAVETLLRCAHDLERPHGLDDAAVRASLHNRREDYSQLHKSTLYDS